MCYVECICTLCAKHLLTFCILTSDWIYCMLPIYILRLYVTMYLFNQGFHRIAHIEAEAKLLSFADDIIKCIFLDENVLMSLKISLKYVPQVPIDNKPSLVQIMPWHRPGDKPLYESMMISLLMYICISWPQWVNSLGSSAVICYHGS